MRETGWEQGMSGGRGGRVWTTVQGQGCCFCRWMLSGFVCWLGSGARGYCGFASCTAYEWAGVSSVGGSVLVIVAGRSRRSISEGEGDLRGDRVDSVDVCGSIPDLKLGGQGM